MNRKTLEASFGNNSDEWETPYQLFNRLDEEFHFTLDPCASEESAKTEKYFTKDNDGMAEDWRGEIVFMNPPYSEIKKWINKAWIASTLGAIVVCLVPARTDTKWWHEFAMKAHEIRFVKGRVKFVDAPFNAPFPSSILIFESHKRLTDMPKLGVQEQ